MTPPTASTVTLTRPSALDETRRILLGGLFQPLGQLVSAGTLGPLAGVGGAVVDLVAKFKGEESTEETAWRLVWLALRDAVDDLADAARFSTTARDSIDTGHLLQLGGEKVDLERIEVPWTFLQRPRDLPLLPVIAGNLDAALVWLGTEPHAARAAAARLPERFGDFFYKRAMQERERLDQLRDLLESEPARALRQSLNWLAYGAHLASELDAPLFAGPFSLRQLYQPLRGYWTERLEGEQGGHAERRNVVDLTQSFDGWLEPFDKSDALRVVAGGPGSGKSSFVKSWAAQVMHRQTMIPTLLLPLHCLDTFDLEREIGIYTEHLGFPENPLGTKAGERRLLLIFDGLDELDVNQKRGSDAASALVTAVDRLLWRKNEHGFQLQVVLAGRTLIVESLQRAFSRERQIFHVLGYAPRQADDEWDDPARRLENDQRLDWWRQWGDLTGEQLAGPPAEIVGNRNLADLADQPLLNHLLAITRAADPAALNESSSVNSVYASVLRHVWERSWGERRQIADIKPLTVKQLHRLFESIGLALWQHGGRSTTLAEVAEVARQEKLDTVLPAFTERAKGEKGALALLTVFFFRRVGSDEAFELTHKTFGEYLAACRLARLIDDLHRLLPSGDINEGEGLRRWYRLTHAARITAEILGFLEEELDRPSFTNELRRSRQQPVTEPRSLDEIRTRRDMLIRLFNENLASGMPFQGVDTQGQPRTYREAERFTAAAELALFAAIGVCTRLMIDRTEGLKSEAQRQAVGWSPTWPDRDQERRTSAWDLLRRLEAGTEGDLCARGYLQGIDLDHQVLRTDLTEACLQFASAKAGDFVGANLFHAKLSFGEFRGAIFRAASLFGACLRGGDFRDSEFFRAELTGANLTEADFESAVLPDVRLAGSLQNTSFAGANLSGASFCASELFSTKFTGANLTNAKFAQARLSAIVLNIQDSSGDYEIGADLTNANVSGADFRDAIGLMPEQLAHALNVDQARLPDAFQEEWRGFGQQSEDKVRPRKQN